MHGAPRTREHEYRSLFDNMRDAILVADTNRRIVDCNAAFTQLFGYQLSEIAGKLTRTLYDSDQDYRTMGDAIRGQASGPNFVTTVRCRSKSGRPFLGETSVSYQEDRDGRITALVGGVRSPVKPSHRDDPGHHRAQGERTAHSHAAAGKGVPVAGGPPPHQEQSPGGARIR